MTGRNMIFMIYEYHRATEADSDIQDFEDVCAVKMAGDDVRALFDVWELCLTGLRSAPSDAVLERIFRAQIQTHHTLRDGMAY